MYDLNEFVDPASGWVLQIAEAINDSNVVVGTGTRNGVIRGFKIALPNLQPCPASTNPCLGPGVRDPQSGECSWPALPNGIACNDGNACTQGDVCNAGSCQGPTTFSCAAPDSCHGAGTCQANQPAPQPPSTQDLIGWWKLDGNGADASGGGHDLTNEGAVPAPGRFGLGMKFDGSSCMTAPVWTDARLQGASGVTMMAWVNIGESYPCPGGAAVMGRGFDYSAASQCTDPTEPVLTGNVHAAGDPGIGYPGGTARCRETVGRWSR